MLSPAAGGRDWGIDLIVGTGFLVQDHEHLRPLLVRCEPENRSAMYDSLKPYLRFTPKPLDVYIAENHANSEIAGAAVNQRRNGGNDYVQRDENVG